MDEAAAKSYDLEAIVASIRKASNPQKVAMDAVADTEGLEDAELLEALGAKKWSDVPTTPYWTQQPGTVPPQMAPRKRRTVPKPGSRKKRNTPKTAAEKESSKEAGDKPSGLSPVERVKAEKKSLEKGLEGANIFMENWMDVLTKSGIFSAEQVRMLSLCLEKSAAFLGGMSAAILMMEEKEDKTDAGDQD